MQQRKRLQFFDLAPDAELLNTDGKPVRLSQLWKDRPLLLAFTRHFGCPQCKEMLDELVQGHSQLETAGLRLAVVTQVGPQETRQFCVDFAPGVECLADPKRQAYAAYVLGHASLGQSVLSLTVLRSNEKLRRLKGWRPEMPPPGQDAMLMSGMFIIGTDGRVRLPYYYDNIADHPPMELLLHGILGVDWGRPLDGPITTGEDTQHGD